MLSGLFDKSRMKKGTSALHSGNCVCDQPVMRNETNPTSKRIRFFKNGINLSIRSVLELFSSVNKLRMRNVDLRRK